jgi:hypothetical protein
VVELGLNCEIAGRFPAVAGAGLELYPQASVSVMPSVRAAVVILVNGLIVFSPGMAKMMKRV